MPSESPWFSRNLSFTDRPDEKYQVHYRDVLQGIKALLGDPGLADHLVYRPSRVFTNRSKDNRIYSEMWTGVWWTTVQVRSYLHITPVIQS